LLFEKPARYRTSLLPTSCAFKIPELQLPVAQGMGGAQPTPLRSSCPLKLPFAHRCPVKRADNRSPALKGQKKPSLRAFSS
jgi:hypothetical protein